MDRVHYVVRYRLDHKDRCLIWHSDETGAEPDGVVVDRAGMIPVFRTPQDLLAYAQAEGLLPVEDNGSGFHNLDAVSRWLKRKRPAQLNCVQFLSAWNLFADIFATISADFDPDKDKTQKIYSKLFWGNNLPAITSAGKHYEPLWSGRESRIIRQVIGDGLSLFRSRVVMQAM